MRILFYTHYYPPEVNAPASRTSEHARVWAEAGHEVTIVTCAPNHPGGKVYPGYKNRLHQTETIDGVKVVRVWTFLAANEGFLRRTLNYLSYGVSVSIATLFLPRPDVIVSTSPQFFCGLAGLLTKWTKRAPWVLEVRDLWPESIVTVGAMKPGLIVRALEWLEALAYRKADKIVVVADSFVPHVAKRGGEGKITVIKNGANLEMFKRPEGDSTVKRDLGLEGRFIAAFVGTHGMAHGLDTILDAAELLRSDPRIVFMLVGDGAKRLSLEQRRADMRLDNVKILGQKPKEAMHGVWAATDASLIVLRRDDLFKKVLPSKMFEAMAMSRPIILGVEGEARELLSEAGAGIAITPESASELADAVTRLANNPTLALMFGERGEAHVREHYDRARLAARYLDLLKETIAVSSARREASVEKAL
jgi:glycosyltransferase involved in cell wall biosynthesis